MYNFFCNNDMIQVKILSGTHNYYSKKEEKWVTVLAEGWVCFNPKNKKFTPQCMHTLSSDIYKGNNENKNALNSQMPYTKGLVNHMCKYLNRETHGKNITFHGKNEDFYALLDGNPFFVLLMALCVR